MTQYTNPWVTVTTDGHLSGTVALPHPYTIPHEETHEYFHVAPTDEGGSVGHVYADTAYAPARATAGDATRHYDTLGTVVADVRVENTLTGDLRVIGTIRPDLPERQQVLLRNPAWLGGDWRNINGRMRLVALILHPNL